MSDFNESINKNISSSSSSNNNNNNNNNQQQQSHDNNNNSNTDVHDHTGDLSHWEYLTKTYDSDPNTMMREENLMSVLQANFTRDQSQHDPISSMPLLPTPDRLTSQQYSSSHNEVLNMEQKQNQYTGMDQFHRSMSYAEQQQQQQQHQQTVHDTLKSATLTTSHHNKHDDDHIRMMMNSSSYPDLFRMHQYYNCHNSYFENSVQQHATNNATSLSDATLHSQKHTSSSSLHVKARSFPLLLNQHDLLAFNKNEVSWKSAPNHQWATTNDMTSLNALLTLDNISSHQPISIFEKSMGNKDQSIEKIIMRGLHQEVGTSPENNSSTYNSDNVATAAMNNHGDSMKVPLIHQKSKTVKATDDCKIKVKKVPRLSKYKNQVQSFPESAFLNANVDSSISANDEQQQQTQQQQPLVLPDWLLQFQQSMILPPHQQLNNKKLLLKPLTPYNYFYRDERDNIINQILDDYDPLPLTVSDFSNEKIQRLLYQHWYIDPLKKKRVHRKTHGKISFQTLSKSIADRWNHLSQTGREFYRTVARYDDIYYRQQKLLLEETNTNVETNSSNADIASPNDDDAATIFNNDNNDGIR